MRKKFFGLRPIHARTVREIVEVAAILLAGVWALYVFVFENEIRPAFSPPTPSFSVEMRHVGNDRNLAVVLVQATVHNEGSGAVNFLGYSITVLGSNVIDAALPRAATGDAFENKLEAYSAHTKQVPIFRDAFITYQGNIKSPRGLFLNSGQTTTFSNEFYVPKGRFDRLEARLIAVYTNSSAIIPTQLSIRPNGLPQFDTPDGVTTYSISAPEAALDLKAQ